MHETLQLSFGMPPPSGNSPSASAGDTRIYVDFKASLYARSTRLRCK